MKNIFLIGTEHQLFQVEMAVEHFMLDMSDVVLVIERTPGNVSFVEKMRKSVKYIHVIIFESWVFKDLFLKRYKHRNFIKFCNNIKTGEITFFASHYSTDSTLLFNAIAKPCKYYLMDEGNASFLVQELRRNKSIAEDIKLTIKSLLYGVRIRMPYAITYFTKFDLIMPQADSKEMYFIERKQNPLSELIKNEVSFIGSSIVELDMIEEADYLEFLNWVRSQHIESHFKYYPHRKESADKLDKIREIGFEIAYTELPFEAYFATQKTFSENLCSFQTTGVLNNISDSNQNLPRLIMYKFDNKFLKKHKAVYENISTVMKNNKLIDFVEI